MAKVLVTDTNLTNIGNAIRSKNGSSTKYKPSEMANAIESIQTGIEANMQTWNQIPTLVKKYLDEVTYDSSDYSTSQIANYAPSTADVTNTYPIGANVNVSSGTLDRNGFEMSVSSGTINLVNDIPNEITEYTVANNGVVTQVGTLKPTGSLRQIKCATANVRDLGGWKCDGGTIKYGKLFRGGEFQSADLDIFLNQLGIKHELNLRGYSEGMEEAVTDLRNHVGFTCPDKYTWYTIDSSYKETWKEILRCVFDCAIKNKPLFFHCSAGADRTGTVACIIEAILGVSQSDLDKDYELTCFNKGVDTDDHARRRNESEWQGLINQINALTVGSTFRDKVINWVASLGFTQDEINSFRKAMIDGTPSDITLSLSTYTITNTLNNASNDNSLNSITQYQPYEANITPTDGYIIDSVSITMGGKDITASVFDGKQTFPNAKVTSNLTGCTSSNQKNVAMLGQSYVAFITTNEGYTLDGATVSLTMGGVDVSKYYSQGKIAIPEVTGDLVITISAVESAPETAPITWTVGKNCTYAVGSACKVSDSSAYMIADKIPVEVGKTYTFTCEWGAAGGGAVYFIGINDSDVVTEKYKWVSSKSGTVSYSWTPTLSTTKYLRLRTYSSESERMLKVTELAVS